MGHKKKDVCEIITSSKAWIVPSGVTKVDVFLVGGGSDGAAGQCCNSGSYGGIGGEVKTYTNISVTPGSNITVHICPANTNDTTYFGSSTYSAKGYKDTISYISSDGTACTFPGLSTSYSYRMGASGARGKGNTASGYYPGGDRGGGSGGVGLAGACPANSNPGGDAWYYGGGGGGASEFCGQSNSAPGGKGYQGIAIIHYIK